MAMELREQAAVSDLIRLAGIAISLSRYIDFGIVPVMKPSCRAGAGTGRSVDAATLAAVRDRANAPNTRADIRVGA